MKDNYSRDSELDLNKILEEYSNIGRDKKQNNYNNAPKNQGGAHNYNRPNNQNIRQNYSNDQNKNKLGKMPSTDKKFVVNIDESLIYSDSNDSQKKASYNSNNGGIYFSNYQKSSRANGSAAHQRSDNKVPVYNDKYRVNVDSKNDKPKLNKVSQIIKKSPKEVFDLVGGKTALIFVSVILFFTIVLSAVSISCLGDMLAINRSDESVEITIPEDADYKEIIDILHDNKLIKNKLFCQLFTKYRHFDDEVYLSGKYYLSGDMGVEGMLHDIMQAPVTADTIKLSFPEGFTAEQIFKKLEENEVCTSNKLYSTAKSNYSYDFFTAIEDNNKRYLKLEGYLFPDTYDFYVGADSNYVIKKFLDNFESKWTPEYQARADKLGYTCDEIITIASIIQKEAANVEQMKLVSSVIHNRLSNGTRFPALECDSTGLYITNYVEPVVGQVAALVYSNYYDTYSVKGLPPGPICNPGMDAIKAALYPEETNYYFFAHDKSGKIYMAETLDGHNVNLAKIAREENRD